MFAETGLLQAGGDRVRVATARARDIAPYRRAVGQSGHRLARWNPVDPEDLGRHLPLQSRDYRTFLIHALAPEGEHDIVGKVNVVNVVRGRFESAAMGYDAYDPYAGRGLFAEGLRLVVGLAFTPEATGGMGLHRVAATVQPGNVRSAGLLRSLGFRREGSSPRMLWLPDVSGSNAWRDHDSYVILRDEWPARPYPTAHGRKVVVLVNGTAGAGTTSLARELAVELAIPLFSRENVAESGPDVLWAFLSDSPVGGVVAGSFGPDDARCVSEGLRACGLEPVAVPEVWHRSGQDGEASARPIGLGHLVVAETGDLVDPLDTTRRAEIVRIALQVSMPAPASET
ncbi:MAG TPA: GNAT family N-acetyltransferase [Dermatophilaceae bacterium]|nr:GNAT family N-acetyltransferase [Dermatophilaceae bacterium]